MFFCDSPGKLLMGSAGFYLEHPTTIQGGQAALQDIPCRVARIKALNQYPIYSIGL